MWKYKLENSQTQYNIFFTPIILSLKKSILKKNSINWGSIPDRDNFILTYILHICICIHILVVPWNFFGMYVRVQQIYRDPPTEKAACTAWLEERRCDFTMKVNALKPRVLVSKVRKSVSDLECFHWSPWPQCPSSVQGASLPPWGSEPKANRTGKSISLWKRWSRPARSDVLILPLKWTCFCRASMQQCRYISSV